jgi:hypothetical protein
LQRTGGHGYGSCQERNRSKLTEDIKIVKKKKDDIHTNRSKVKPIGVWFMLRYVYKSDYRHSCLSLGSAIFYYYLVCEAIGTEATPGTIVPASGDSEDDCGEADGM